MSAILALAILLQAAPDRMTVKIESTLELDIVVRDASGETPKLASLQRQETFTQVPIDGKSVRVTCTSSRLQRSGSDTPLEEKPTALSGRSYVATRTEAGWNVRDDQGQAAPSDGQNLGAWNDAVRLLPADGKVVAGARWSVEAKDLVPLISPTSLREATGKLDCTCESVEGGRAQIVFTGSLKGKGPEGTTMTVSLDINSGRMMYDTGRQKVLMVSMSGAFESVLDQIDVSRKPNTLNEEERRKIGEISMKSRKLETTITFE